MATFTARPLSSHLSAQGAGKGAQAWGVQSSRAIREVQDQRLSHSWTKCRRLVRQLTQRVTCNQVGLNLQSCSSNQESLGLVHVLTRRTRPLSGLASGLLSPCLLALRTMKQLYAPSAVAGRASALRACSVPPPEHRCPVPSGSTARSAHPARVTVQ